MEFISIVIGAFLGAQITAFTTPAPGVAHASTLQEVEESVSPVESVVPVVPFYSQFADINSPYWQKRGCGVASLAMLVEYFTGEPVSVDTLLEEGRTAGAYIQGAGWSHQGLVNLSRAYGLDGEPRSLAHLSNEGALAELREILKDGPVIASVHYTFKPTNPIPHLAVVNGISGDTVYYNDPANPGPGDEISKEGFLAAWKKRAIAIRPE